MSKRVAPMSLTRYQVDRDRGATASGGITEIVVLTLTDVQGDVRCYVLSKVDARVLGSQLNLAALDAQKVGS